MNLEHRPSGNVVNIGNVKGSFSFDVHYEDDAWTRAFKDDAAALLALLLSSECRHPCGYPAGTVDPALLDKWPSMADDSSYIVDPVSFVLDRLTDEDEAFGERIRKAWKRPKEKDCALMRGTDALVIKVNKATGKVTILPLNEAQGSAKRAKTEGAGVGKADGTAEEEVPLFAAISSAMLLYRVVVSSGARGFIFFGGLPRDPYVATPLDGDKPSPDSVWHVELMHMASGLCARFGDWRGAASVWMKEAGRPEWETTKAKTDLVELLEYLCSPKCSHPYDGVVAGTCA